MAIHTHYSSTTVLRMVHSTRTTHDGASFISASSAATEQPPSTGKFHIKDLCPRHTKDHPGPDTDPVHAVVTINGTSHKTDPIIRVGKDGLILWDKKFSFGIHEESILKVEIYQKRHWFRHSVLIGHFEAQIVRLLAPFTPNYCGVSVSRELERPPDVPDRYHPFDLISFTIELESEPGKKYAMEAAIHKESVKNRAAQRSPESSEIGDRHSGGHANGVMARLAHPNLFLERLEKFFKITAHIAELHPFAKIAHKVISSVGHLIIDQARRDNDIDHLIELMYDTYNFMESDDADALNEIMSHKRVTVQLVEQTNHCCHFIAEYYRDGFCSRILKHTFSATDAAIVMFGKAFANLKTAWVSSATLNTEVVTMRVLGEVDKLEREFNSQVLADLPYAKGARYRREICCPHDSPEHKVAEEEYHWINDLTSDNGTHITLLLTSPGSTGTSTIAHTIARHYDHLKRLGSSIFVEATEGNVPSPELFFPTIARDLADMEPHFEHALSETIHHTSEAVRHTRSLNEQFEQFLLVPFQELTIFGPIVIVIDAFSESGGFREFVSLLIEKASQLPVNFRILIVCPSGFYDRLSSTAGIRTTSL